MAQLCNTALWIDHGEIRSVGEVSEVVGQYEGPEVGEYVRDLRQPFGGTKASGVGREGGTWSYEVFLEPKNVCVSLGSHHIPHWGA